MKKPMMWISGVLISCSLLMGACRKKDDTPARSQLIIGTWAVNAYGNDDNMNGVLDESEHKVIPAGASLVITLRTDNSGVATLDSTGKMSVTKGFTWQLINGDDDIKVTVDNNVTIVHIAKLTTNDLQGYDQAASPRLIVDLRK